MPLSRVVRTVGASRVPIEPASGGRWRIVTFEATDNPPLAISIGASRPGVVWSVAGLDQASIVALFAALSFDVATQVALADAITGAEVTLGPRKADGSDYAPEDQVLLGTVTRAEQRGGLPAERTDRTGQRIDRLVLAIPNMPPLGSGGALWDQVTVLPPASAAGAPAEAWCELVDVATADELELTAAGVAERGTEYNARLRVRYDAGWRNGLFVTFDGIEYRIASVAEDTAYAQRRFMLLGLRRSEV